MPVVTTTVGSEVTLVWDVRIPVTAQVSIPWQIFIPVTAQVSIPWQIFMTVGQAVPLQWDVRRTVGQNVAAVWNDLIPVGANLQLSWDIRKTVGAVVSPGWNDLIPVGANLQLSWDIRKTVGQNVVAVWNIAALVHNSSIIEWVVCAFANPHKRGSVSGPTPLPDSGSFIYQDDYGQLYRKEWQWVYGRTVLDMTVTIEQPYVWGEEPRGEFRGKDLYRWGVVTVHRTVAKPTPSGYEILAEGYTQYIDWVRSSFHCSPLPVDPFLYHLNQGITDQVEGDIKIGPRLALPGDSAAVWGTVNGAGHVTGGQDVLAWTDVWSH